MSNRDEYVAQLKAQLEQWATQMMAWESAVRDATAETKIELEKQLGILRSRLDDTAFRMEQMKGASADAWQEIARGADEARKTMQVAFDKARAKFDDI